MIEYQVENAAPEHDTISVDLNDCGGEEYRSVNITVSRAEDGKVSIAVTPFGGETEWHVLGENPGVLRV